MTDDRVSPTPAADGRPSFLVIRCGAIGDTLMATPAVRALRRSFPASRIAFLASAKATDAVRYNPHIDEVFSLAGRKLPFWLSREKQQLARRVRERPFDVALSLESDPRFTTLAARFGAARLITYDTTAPAGAEIIAPREGEHSAELHRRAAAAAGAAPDADLRMEFPFPAALSQRVAERLADEFNVAPDARLIGLHAGWGGRRQHPLDTRLRSWPADRFAEIARRLHQHHGARIILTGSSADRPLNDFISANAGVETINAAGRFSLLETASLIKRLELFVSIDSGPAHIAAAVGTPLVTLWGPGIFTATRPLAGEAAVQIVRRPPPCAPCYGTTLMRACSDNVCMKNISPDDVIESISTVIRS